MMILFMLANAAAGLFLAWDTWRLLPVQPGRGRQALLGVLAVVFLFASMTTTVGYSVMVYYAAFLLPVQLVWRLVKKNWRAPWMAALICLLLAGGMTIWGMVHYDQRVATHYTLETEKDAAGRLVFLSDLHYPTGMTEQELSGLVTELEAENPDAYILGGDIVDEYTMAQEARQAFEILGKLEKTAPVFYVPGNHDDQEEGILPPVYTAQELDDMIESAGIRILRDDTVTVGDFELSGRDDYRQHKKDRKAASDLVKDTEKYDVVIDHQPVQSEKVREAGADLMLSGHTHNGQLWPFGYLIHLHPKMDQVSGIRQEDGFTQITSDGIGGWGFAARTAGNSEYVVVDVVPEADTGQAETA
ncbi:metallophosphoesterase [Faecalibaculum rodentium]|uniref:metallophosphoesterase n=1 Tax=Faecalibaculum rodentium TaxID=1702221 RepID=UPI0023F3E678|nr:metallophosphoesterase [Faecalibaculum rodentium]